ncbi:MAG: zinc ribbon domain-containing protein [Nitrospirales bacterium]|nr:zinc ribbon domain-containing protein [Nitrospirales bacterium]
MPIYEYQCLECGKSHEIIQKFSDAPMEKCPACGGQMKKLISNTSFVLKGTGWYVTDYASKNKNSATPASKPAEKTTPTESGAAAETKKEANPAGQA